MASVEEIRVNHANWKAFGERLRKKQLSEWYPKAVEKIAAAKMVSVGSLIPPANICLRKPHRKPQH